MSIGEPSPVSVILLSQLVGSLAVPLICSEDWFKRLMKGAAGGGLTIATAGLSTSTTTRGSFRSVCVPYGIVSASSRAPDCETEPTVALIVAVRLSPWLSWLAPAKLQVHRLRGPPAVASSGQAWPPVWPATGVWSPAKVAVTLVNAVGTQSVRSDETDASPSSTIVKVAVI